MEVGICVADDILRSAAKWKSSETTVSVEEQGPVLMKKSGVVRRED
jgi:hypothetical protein